MRAVRNPILGAFTVCFLWYRTNFKSWDSAGGVKTGYVLGRLLFASRQGQEILILWGIPSRLSVGMKAFSPGLKRPGYETDQSHVVPWSGVVELYYTRTPHTTKRRGD